MTIEELLAATGLTANDLVPIYDAEAAQNVEPTQKITAAQLAAAVKVLASLVNTTEMNAAIQQSTATTALFATQTDVHGGNVTVTLSDNISNYRFIAIHFSGASGNPSTSRAFALVPYIMFNVANAMYIPIAIGNNTQYIRLEAANNKLTIISTSANALYLQTVYGIK